MGQAAYKTLVKVAGKSTPFTNAATTKAGETGSGFSLHEIYQINDVPKRMLDREVAVIVKKGSVVIPSSNYEVEYLKGVVAIPILFMPIGSGSITVSASYIPLTTVVGAQQYSIEITGDVLDDTGFTEAQSSNGHRSRVYGLTDVSVSLNRYDNLSKYYVDKLLDRGIVLIEIKPNNGAETILGWFRVESTNKQGGVAELEMEDITFQISGIGNDSSTFSWS